MERYFKRTKRSSFAKKARVGYVVESYYDQSEVIVMLVAGVEVNVTIWKEVCMVLTIYLRRMNIQDGK